MLDIIMEFRNTLTMGNDFVKFWGLEGKSVEEKNKVLMSIPKVTEYK